MLELDGMDEWREGDLMLRCGWGAESRMVTARGHSAYSHIGILHYAQAEGRWMVVHAVPAEDEPELLKAEPVEVFFGADRAKAGAWMRVECEDSIARAAARYALGKVADSVLFDNDYLLADTSRLYCSELVWQSYMHQGLDITAGRRHSVPEFFCKEGECIFPSDIEQSEMTLFVKPFKTKTL